MAFDLTRACERAEIETGKNTPLIRLRGPGIF
jgi:hypothetical protein